MEEINELHMELKLTRPQAFNPESALKLSKMGPQETPETGKGTGGQRWAMELKEASAVMSRSPFGFLPYQITAACGLPFWEPLHCRRPTLPRSCPHSHTGPQPEILRASYNSELRTFQDLERACFMIHNIPKGPRAMP